MIHVATTYRVSLSNSTRDWDTTESVTFSFSEEPSDLRTALQERVLNMSDYTESAKILGFKLHTASPPPEEMHLSR